MVRRHTTLATVLLLLLAGALGMACRKETTVNRTAIPCEPALPSHDEDPANFMGYRFVGGSEDGRRQALVVRYFGPGSGAPTVRVYVREAGVETPVVAQGDFEMGARGVDALAALEKRMVAAVRPRADAANVVWGANEPTAIPWCRGPDGRIYARPTEGVKTLALTRQEEKDEAGEKLIVLRLVGEGDAPSLTARMNQGHLIVASDLHALYRANGIWWMVTRFDFDKLGGEGRFSFTIVSGQAPG